MLRFYLALHATVPAALAAALLLHLLPPAGLEPLAHRPPWADWTLIGGWILASALLAALARGTARLWRTALAAAGLLLAIAGATGWALGAPMGPAVFAGLLALGLGCAGVAMAIGPGRVQAARPARAAAHARSANHPHPGARSRRRRLRAAAAHWPFWLAGTLALECFRVAHLAAPGPARPAGMLGLLLACFVVLPAATVRSWLPRTGAALWMLAALCYAALAARAGLAHWWVAAALCALAAVHALHAARQRGQPDAHALEGAG
ncbi:hypothetical protein QRO11_04685 [Paracidovorax citrulli]|uniref:Uncharacterized protein n=5 Tax=Paracidovorax citrulli TaxID=80869 RepID=A1TU24_PARC0|nr:hypothetical protein [Paracidovorax citrulli]ABM34462.1 hypothetical protein Aave_3919 [Paracidovorax citrulli AAC00-1]ATG93925.1 hypothetical protein CQB05_07700 [Paracidovorax citrulli]PVY63903.1 hypothetical protein C8E08_1208 [Paracidovorax citrulli]QCX09873.1 hypothetical protein APS58_0957 [Paracidovorax citrulli]REG67135.1 hypothetical protein C8E07_0185 [Paracidovorax citrulli]